MLKCLYSNQREYTNARRERANTKALIPPELYNALELFYPNFRGSRFWTFCKSSVSVEEIAFELI